MFHERWRPCETFASLRGRSFIHDNSHVVSNFNMLTVSKHERCTYAEVERGSGVRVYEFTRLFYIRRNVSSVFRAIFFVGQEPVANKKKIEKRDWIADGRNVLSKMQRTFGPLGMLHEYMENRTRIKVYTRNARGIRGHVEAYVAAFDKHWNLALEDCFEIWTRKVKRKAPALGMPSGARTMDEETAPKVIVKKIEGKMETLERHVPQMLLRGEQVAIIVKIN
ncbi:uncharacterized protein LOC107997068 isoform X2 [Apis cerana]|uniref:uncharacterized protein LOC107997068 isoform X2 n=1 Tax=Apis cerana TaxID=7461 RepID=UPI002B221D34|nr:uncharacterized protein LOC107997068 isoform X2 [Apis cerana]